MGIWDHARDDDFANIKPFFLGFQLSFFCLARCNGVGIWTNFRWRKRTLANDNFQSISILTLKSQNATGGSFLTENDRDLSK